MSNDLPLPYIARHDETASQADDMERPMDAIRRAGGLGTLGVLASEFSALVRVVGALSWRSGAADTLDVDGSHPVPVVLVHGLLGDPTNFAIFRHRLARHGIRRSSSFCYRPRLDYQRLAARFGEHVSAVCCATGAAQVDVVAHSLGGLVARYFVQTGGARSVRRLVTLGTPYLASANPPQELSIFGEHDAIVPPPVDLTLRRIHVLDACGHFGLLIDERAVAAVARYLSCPAAAPRLATRAQRIHGRRDVPGTARRRMWTRHATLTRAVAAPQA